MKRARIAQPDFNYLQIEIGEIGDVGVADAAREIPKG